MVLEIEISSHMCHMCSLLLGCIFASSSFEQTELENTCIHGYICTHMSGLQKVCIKCITWKNNEWISNFFFCTKIHLSFEFFINSMKSFVCIYTHTYTCVYLYTYVFYKSTNSFKFVLTGSLFPPFHICMYVFHIGMGFPQNIKTVAIYFSPVI